MGKALAPFLRAASVEGPFGSRRRWGEEVPRLLELSPPPSRGLGSVRVKDFPWSVTSRERYRVTFFCRDGALQTHFSDKTSLCGPYSRPGPG